MKYKLLLLMIVAFSYAWSDVKIRVSNPDVNSEVKTKVIYNGVFTHPRLVLVERLSRLGINYVKHGEFGSSFSQKERKFESIDNKWDKLPINNLELIKNGEDTKKYSALYNILKSKIDITELEQLQIRDFYLDKSFVSEIDGKLFVPFSYSVRYKEGVIKQGTLDVEGFFEFNLETQRVDNISLMNFADSQFLEVYGRNQGYLLDYDIEFLENISCLGLSHIFNDISIIHGIGEQLAIIQNTVKRIM